jgi:hypothetical protein
MYLPQNATQEFLGDLRAISQPTVSRIVTSRESGSGGVRAGREVLSRLPTLRFNLSGIRGTLPRKSPVAAAQTGVTGGSPPGCALPPGCHSSAEESPYP